MSVLIICLTIIFCVVWITLWIKHMVVRNLPLFTYGQCVWKDADSVKPSEAHPIGFKAEEDEDEDKLKGPTNKEQKEAYLKDPVTLTAALLRGEVDIDDIYNRT